ncbi:uncharacterized protein LOC144870804 [Branchiostoma floridae x Branchiostoma japonicum]
MSGTRASPLWLLVFSAIAMLYAEEVSSLSRGFRPPVSEPDGAVGCSLQANRPKPADPDAGRSRQRRRGLPSRLPPFLVGRVPPIRWYPETTPRTHGTSAAAIAVGATTEPVVTESVAVATESVQIVHPATHADKTDLREKGDEEHGEFAGCGELESCAGRCGEWNSTFNCQCDPDCYEFDDCCRDHHTECGTTSNGTGGDRGAVKVIMADSCRWRCEDDTSDWPCSCVAGCVRAGNCCADHHLFCMRNGTREEEHPDDRKPLKCIGTPGFHGYYWMVATCPPAVQDATVRNMCEGPSDPDEDALRHLPVFDPTTGTSYRNLYCAYCNNATKKLSWVGYVMCSMGGTIRRMVSRPVNNPFCDWELVPRVMERSCVPRSIDTSPNSSCDRDRCFSYTANVYLHGPTGVKKYRNIDCARCASASLWPNVTCFSDEASELDLGYARAQSIRILFDFSEMSRTKTQLNDRTGTRSCPFGKVYDPFRLSCRSLVHDESFRHTIFNITGARLGKINTKSRIPIKGNMQSDNSEDTTQTSGISLLPSHNPIDFGRRPTEESSTYATWPNVQSLPTIMLPLSGRGTVLIVANSSSMLLLLVFGLIHTLIGKSRRSPGSVLRLHLVLALFLFHGGQTAGQVVDSSGGPWKMVVACTMLFCLVSKLTATIKFGAASTRCRPTGLSATTACAPLVLIWAVSGVVTLTAIILYDPQPPCFGPSHGPFDGVISCSTAPYATITSYGGVLLLSTAADVFFTSAICRSRLTTRHPKLSKKELMEAFWVSALLTVVFTANLIISAFSFQTVSYVTTLVSSLLGSLVAAVYLFNMGTKQSKKENLDGCNQDENASSMGSSISLVSFRQIAQ